MPVAQLVSMRHRIFHARRLFYGNLDPVRKGILDIIHQSSVTGHERIDTLLLKLLLFHSVINPVMLSRAVLPLARRNVLASTVRVSALSAQRPRWYAKGKTNTPYTLPDSLQDKDTQSKDSKSTKKQATPQKAEAESQATPETEAPEPTTAVGYS